MTCEFHVSKQDCESTKADKTCEGTQWGPPVCHICHPYCLTCTGLGANDCIEFKSCDTIDLSSQPGPANLATATYDNPGPYMNTQSSTDDFATSNVLATVTFHCSNSKWWYAVPQVRVNPHMDFVSSTITIGAM
jgi:hypothetical protein